MDFRLQFFDPLDRIRYAELVENVFLLTMAMFTAGVAWIALMSILNTLRKQLAR